MAETTDAAALDPRPTIVFLHGTVLSGAAWSPQVAALRDDFHCLTPDLPGHGTAAAEPFDVETAARRVAELIDRDAHGRRAILVGLSLGGYVAITVAARWPERVRALAIAGATADPVGLQALGFHALALALDLAPEPIVDRVYRWFFRLRFKSEITDPVFAGGFWFPGGVVALRALVGRRFAPVLAEYPGPSLLINGEFDLFFRPTERDFAHAAADPRRVLIRRSAHLTNLEQPAAFTAAIRRFATRVGGDERSS